MSDRRKLVNDLTDVMARVLYYQEHGDLDLTNATYRQAVEETERLPEKIVQQYRNDPRFHAQVTRAVALALRVIPDADRGRAALNELHQMDQEIFK